MTPTRCDKVCFIADMSEQKTKNNLHNQDTCISRQTEEDISLKEVENVLLSPTRQEFTKNNLHFETNNASENNLHMESDPNDEQVRIPPTAAEHNCENEEITLENEKKFKQNRSGARRKIKNKILKVKVIGEK